jgi:hypothetical protein
MRLLDDYGIDYSESGVNTSPDFVNTKCIFCDDDPSNHLGWHRGGEYVSCWICGRHTIEKALSNLLSIEYFEAIKLIEEYSDRYSTFLSLNKKELKRKKIELPGEELKEMHRKYLIKRGFDPDYIINKYKVKGTGFTGRWKYRIIIPIFSNNRLVSFQGRDITDKQKLRYMTLSKEESGFDLGTTFYGLDECRDKDIVGVVEGCFDRWNMGNNFIAVLTSNLTDFQIKILSCFKKVVFIFDPEKEAYKNAKKVAIRLNMLGVNSYVIMLDEGEDPADLKKDDIKYIRKEMGLI